MAVKDWVTNYPASQDTGADAEDQQPTLINEDDDTRVSQIHTLRSKVQSLALQVGDNSNLPAGSLLNILDLDSGDARQLRMFERGADPADAADKGTVYCKDASGVTQLFFIDSNGAVHQITPPPAGFDLYGSTLTVQGNSVSPPQLGADQSGAVLTNQGSGAQIDFTLPTAAAGLWFRFVAESANSIKILPDSGDALHFGPEVSSSYFESVDQGDSVTLVAVNAAKWHATAIVGTWNPPP